MLNWLEAQFRRQFERRGDFYLFRQVDREVMFDREDVEEFVAEWRRYWRSPLLWGLLLIVGIAIPAIYMIWRIETGLVFVAILSPVALICSMVCLWVAQRGPAEAAFNRESVGPGHGWPSYGNDIFGIAAALFWLAAMRPDGVFGVWAYLIFGAVLVVSTVRLVRALRHRRRASL